MKTVLISSALAATVLIQSATNPQQDANPRQDSNPEHDSNPQQDFDAAVTFRDLKNLAQVTEDRAATLRATHPAQQVDRNAARLIDDLFNVQRQAAGGQSSPAELAGRIGGLLERYASNQLGNSLVDTTPGGSQLLILQKQHEAAEAASLKLAQHLRGLKSPTAEQQQELRRLVQQAFDLKLRIQEQQVEPLRIRLARIEQAIADRKASGDRIVGRRVEDLLNPGLQWTGVTEKVVDLRSTSPLATRATRASSPEVIAAAPQAQATQPVVVQTPGTQDPAGVVLEGLRAAEAAVKQSKADFARLQDVLNDPATTESRKADVNNTLRQFKVSLPELDRRWKAAWSEYQSALKVAQLQFEAAELQVKQADAKAKRMRELVERGLAGKSDVFDSELESKLAVIDMTKAKQLLSRLQDAEVRSPDKDAESDSADETKPSPTN